MTPASLSRSTICICIRAVRKPEPVRREISASLRNENVCASPMRNLQTGCYSKFFYKTKNPPPVDTGARLGGRPRPLRRWGLTKHGGRRQCRIGANRLRPLYEVFQQTFLQKAFQSRLKIVTVFQLSPMYVLLVPLQALPSGSDKTETNKHIKNKAPNRPQEANRIAHHYEYGQRHSKPHGKD